jgi:hypothetical protein
MKGDYWNMRGGKAYRSLIWWYGINPSTDRTVLTPDRWLPSTSLTHPWPPPPPLRLPTPSSASSTTPTPPPPVTTSDGRRCPHHPHPSLLTLNSLERRLPHPSATTPVGLHRLIVPPTHCRIPPPNLLSPLDRGTPNLNLNPSSGVIAASAYCNTSCYENPNQSH